jgi:hypothetical protein
MSDQDRVIAETPATLPAGRGELDSTIAETLPSLGADQGKLNVALSNELVQLLSDQLYQSPLKAVEELVVNSYDAEAKECRVYVPTPDNDSYPFVVVYDDGIGMDKGGLEDLWHIGRSNKRSEEVEARARRKQIGKFGIGKLATYAIANRITYVTRKSSEIRAVTLDFRKFSNEATGAQSPVTLTVRQVDDWSLLRDDANFEAICQASGVSREALFERERDTWTFCILEDLKEKVKKLRLGRLRWVLSTAMPLINDFHLFLNGQEIASSKEGYDAAVEFSVHELPPERLESLQQTTGEEWDVVDSCLRSESFPAGVRGPVLVTKRSLHGKSDDLLRSNGFFIRVRGRLVNENEPLFGLTPGSYETFNRFRADLDVDDLDAVVTAPREGVESSELKNKLRALMSEVFNEARQRYQKVTKAREHGERYKREEERNYVDPRYVEYSIADVLVSQGNVQGKVEADESWFYLEIKSDSNPQEIARILYSQPRRSYSYVYTQRGRLERLVKFDPATSTFLINEDHDLVRSHADDGRAQWLLEDFVTAEALLEVYLREHQVPSHVVGGVLERRDGLLRRLSEDHPFSLKAISAKLRESADDERDLEMVLVAAARALGFVATHIGGDSEPDGIARFTDYPSGEQKIILEAKSSGGVPSLSHIDYAGLQEHMDNHNAQGCLLVAPSYPGARRGSSSAASNRSERGRISCWTVEQLAQVVAAAESRHITARDVLDIVLNHFAPDDVAPAVERLLRQPNWQIRDLYLAVLKALRSLEGRLPDRPRTVDMVLTEVSHDEEFVGIQGKNVEKAIRELAHASQGLMNVSGDNIILVHGSYEEIERRLNGLTGQAGEPRRGSTFRSNNNGS